MENFVGMKLKRKDLEEVNDDFSDFSLSSPAHKIRRLDAELPPIIEEEEAGFQLGFEQGLPERFISNGSGIKSRPLVIEELPSVPENEEKAIVLFKPMNNSPPVFSQGNFSIDPNFVSCFKNQAFWSKQLNPGRLREKDKATDNENNGEENACMAVIPWVPSRTLHPSPETLAQTEVSESMDTEEMEATTMEIEDADAANIGRDNLSRLNDGLQHQWHQQHHCMILQPPQNTTTPIVWYR